MMATTLHRIILAVAFLTCARTATAQTFSAGGGLFIGVQLGKGQPSFSWGGELFTTHYLQGSGSCLSDERAGLGPLLQFALSGVSDPRITLAAHGGGQFVRSMPAPALEGELGGSFYFRNSRLALHTGLLLELAPLLNLAVRHQLFQGQTALHGGFRYQPTYGLVDSCIAGS